MESENIERKIKDHQQEYRKGAALIEDTKARMLRIEGAIIQLQELMRELEKAKSLNASQTSLNSNDGKAATGKNLETAINGN